jgi:tetratricopeptide (TPR) repeat protein
LISCGPVRVALPGTGRRQEALQAVTIWRNLCAMPAWTRQRMFQTIQVVDYQSDRLSHSPSTGPAAPLESRSAVKAVKSTERLAWILSALLVLVLHVDWHLAMSALPLYSSPAVDEALHWQWAQDLASGLGSPELPYFRAPLYPWWLGMLHRAGLGLPGLRWAGTLSSLATLALLVALIHRSHGRKAALAALLLGGGCATWIHYEAQLLLEHTVLLWLVVASAALWGSVHKKAGWREGLFGLSLGLAAITRPNALVLAPLALLLLWRQAEGWRGWGKRALWWVAGWLPPLALVATLNGWPGSGVLVASQGGVNLWIGTHGGADGWSATLPEVGPAWERADATGLAARELGHHPDPGEESAFYTRRALDWAFSHPGQLAGQLVWKAALLLAPQESGNNTNPLSLSKQRGWMHLLLPWSWWLLLLPGLTGLMLGFPKPTLLRRWILGALLLYAASFLPFFMAGRFRIPLLGLLALPAAAWLGDLWQSRRLRMENGATPGRGRRMVLGLLLMLPLAAGTWVASRLDGAHQKRQEGWQAFQLGNAWLRLDEGDSARARFQEALTLAPGLRELRLNLGLLDMPGHPARAESLFLAEIQVDGRSAKAWNNLGSLWLHQGQAQRAVEAFGEALRLRPDLPNAAWNLGLALATRGLEEVRLGHWDSARASLNTIKATPYRGRGLVALQQLLKEQGLSSP